MTREHFWTDQFNFASVVLHDAPESLPPEGAIAGAAAWADLSLAEYDKRFSAPALAPKDSKVLQFPKSGGK